MRNKTRSLIALLLLASPLLVGCKTSAEPILEVRPATPEPQAKLTLPRILTDPVPMPWRSAALSSTP